ncbi:tryptophan--tRNA ligase [Alkalihalobacillus pseudalcaliphilus]|uniref:tryptophan--tRNA ligase n=1 Tax=Alkalihalobacillus pseudalcaliphilus TaxID=79884 RepID=UPI00236203F1|nr:tryptophan--tRNA ligase [Alkalihalobacillus pseudalcaliphilus]
MCMKKVITGIKPTGTIHVGNYAGAIKPALQFLESDEYTPLYFIANMHALNTVTDAELLRKQTLEIAATWLALGLNPTQSLFYCQSDIPELFELNWILANLTPKGLMNRAHAYKALVDKNTTMGLHRDDGVNMGLFNYPILMSADILLFDADLVPVGKDQIQHIEIARDLAQTFNQKYGETFASPEGYIEKDVAILPGLDGRKMSKSYNNVIPLFSEAAQLNKLIKQVKTDSSLPHEAKDPNTSPLFTLYQAFAKDDEVLNMREHFRNGIGWGAVKDAVFEVMNRELTIPREQFQNLVSKPKEIEDILQDGATKARMIAKEKLIQIKERVGLLHI